MKLLDYIRGKRKGKDANRIEKDSMRDPFLYEAIEGFDSVGGDHFAHIQDLQRRFKSRPQAKVVVVRQRSLLMRIAAVSTVVLVSFSVYMFISYQRSAAYAHGGRDLSTIEIYVPASFYEQNEVIIEEQNEILAESYKPEIEAFKIEDDLSATHSKEELDLLLKDAVAVEDQDVMDLYIPDNNRAQEAEVNLMYYKSIGKTEPMGGFGKYDAYLKKNKILPTDGICAERHGQVAVEFSIDESGQPYQFVVIQSLCGVSDKEAIRLLKSGPKWIPTNERIIVKIEF